MSDASPYQPPRSAITPPTATDHTAVRLFSSQGRLGRVRYIGYSVGLGLLINLAAGLLGGVAAFWSDGDGQVQSWLGGGLLIAMVALAVVGSILLTVQRLHDFDASGWWAALIVAPFANIVLYLVLLMMPGTQGPNRFGKPPPPNTLGVILLAMIPPLILVLGILSAIAIPAYMKYQERALESRQPPAPAQQ